MAALLIAPGLFVLGVAVLGLFRFDDVLNRIHVAAKCDTLGAMLFLSGLIVLAGFSFTSLKLLFILIFLWLTNPVASHLIAKTEFQTAADLEDRCDVIDLTLSETAAGGDPQAAAGAETEAVHADF